MKLKSFAAIKTNLDGRLSSYNAQKSFYLFRDADFSGHTKIETINYKRRKNKCQPVRNMNNAYFQLHDEIQVPSVLRKKKKKEESNTKNKLKVYYKFCPENTYTQKISILYSICSRLLMRALVRCIGGSSLDIASSFPRAFRKE